MSYRDILPRPVGPLLRSGDVEHIDESLRSFFKNLPRPQIVSVTEEVVHGQVVKVKRYAFVKKNDEDAA